MASVAREEIALTFDDGPDPETTPRVLDLLDALGARASFFCIGSQARRHPALCSEIVRRGHSVENHSLHHRWDFAFSGYRGFVREIAEAQATLAEITGQAPRFFRAPFGIRNPLLEPALTQSGLQLVSWTRRGFDTRECRPEIVLRRLARQLAAGDILLLHDGHAARAADGQAVVLRVLPELLERIRTAGLRMVTLPQVQP
jgi:peptidoglycan/xylan/chitin deacetylase (PgdA/CDA1 family)